MTGAIAHVPVPRCDETLSSLILRLAHNHAASAHELCALLWPRFEFWTRDIDRTASDALLATVAGTTGLNVATLRQCTLQGIVRAMGFPERVQGQQDGILPIGVYHRIRRRFGQQYCPICLSERPTYLRRLWRLEFVVACPKHGVLLRDACPKCKVPFIPHRRNALVEHRCHVCGASLITGRSRKPLPNAVLLQQSFLAALVASLGEAGDMLKVEGLTHPDWPILERVPAKEYIDGVRRLCRLASSVVDQASRMSVGKHPKSWSLLRTPARAAIMAVVGRWLSDWPKTWLLWVRANDLTQHYLDYHWGPWPAWVAAVTVDIPYSHGPVGIHRHRKRTSLRQLRRRQSSVGAYRETRARCLLVKAGVVRRLDR